MRESASVGGGWNAAIMAERPLHFDGPMMIGGEPYPVDEVLRGLSMPRISTGFDVLDEVTGGIGRGEVWAIIGAAGVGVTSLCNAIAASASRSDEVVVCNGHVPSLALIDNLRRAGATDRLRVASWLAPPHIDLPQGGDGHPVPALVVYDTWDETQTAGLHGTTYTQLVESLRMTNRLAGRAWMSLVLGVRALVEPREEPRGWVGEAVAETAHVTIGLRWEDSKLIAAVIPCGRPGAELELLPSRGRVCHVRHI